MKGKLKPTTFGPKILIGFYKKGSDASLFSEHVTCCTSRGLETNVQVVPMSSGMLLNSLYESTLVLEKENIYQAQITNGINKAEMGD